VVIDQRRELVSQSDGHYHHFQFAYLFALPKCDGSNFSPVWQRATGSRTDSQVN
jgi:hypothetical protein